MKGLRAFVVLLLAVTLAVGLVPVGFSGEAEKPYRIKMQEKTPQTVYEGQIKSVRIDKCGLQPGSCEGSVILAKKGGGEVTLAIRPGTWIQRGKDLVLIDELGVGNYVRLRAAKLAGEPLERVLTIDMDISPE